MEDIVLLISRVFISSLYIWAASAKIWNWKGTVAYMESKGFPFISLSLPAAVVLQIGGGLSLLLGFYSQIGALVLILFTIPAMFKIHNFWKETGSARVVEKTLFMKDLAVLGGLLLFLLYGPGSFSI